MPVTEALTKHLKFSDIVPGAGLVGGEWVPRASDGKLFEVTNPSNGDLLAVLPDMGVAEARRAIALAEAAQIEWARKTGKARAAILRRLYDLMMKHQDDLAAIMTAEQGKPLAESKGEIAYAASFIDWAAEEGKRLYGDLIPASAGNKRILALRQPEIGRAHV